MKKPKNWGSDITKRFTILKSTFISHLQRSDYIRFLLHSFQIRLSALRNVKSILQNNKSQCCIGDKCLGNSRLYSLVKAKTSSIPVLRNWLSRDHYSDGQNFNGILRNTKKLLTYKFKDVVSCVIELIFLSIIY